MWRAARALWLIPPLLLVACNKEPTLDAPPRLTAEAEVPVATSRVIAPIAADLGDLEQRLNAAAPKTLFRIDRQEDVCVPPARITVCLKHVRPCKGDACKDVPCKVGVKKAGVTPPMSCRIVGAVTRGRIRLSGSGERLKLRMPVAAEISANDVGKILSETATAKAETRADIRLGMTPGWTPTAKVDIDYSWTEKPGIELLGRRFTFAGRADPELAKVIARIERDIPRELQALQPRRKLEEVWAKAFTVIELNAKNPPVWLRLTPERLSYGGYEVKNGQLILKLQLEAGAETFVGERPPDPAPTPLPDSGPLKPGTGFRVVAPVIADYAELEPVLHKALTKLAAKPVMVPEIGAVNVSFGKPSIYATEGGRLAIGLSISARRDSRVLGSADGVVWLTGLPWNEPDSPVVRVKDLAIDADTNNAATDLLLAIARSPDVMAELESALTQDFSRDLAKLKVKIDKTLADKRLGDFILDVQLDTIRYGVVKPLGQGAYLPVEVSGNGQIRWDPQKPAVRR